MALRMLRAAIVLLALTPAVALAKPRPIQIKTLSNRADLISDGQALVQVRLPRGAKARTLQVTLNAATSAARSNAAPAGGSKPSWTASRSANTLKATAKRARGAQLTITNHPNGGPIFGGPQVQPWRCQQGAVDAQRNQPPQCTYLYRTSPARAGSPTTARPTFTTSALRTSASRRSPPAIGTPRSVAGEAEFNDIV